MIGRPAVKAGGNNIDQAPTFPDRLERKVKICIILMRVVALYLKFGSFNKTAPGRAYRVGIAAKQVAGKIGRQHGVEAAIDCDDGIATSSGASERLRRGRLGRAANNKHAAHRALHCFHHRSSSS